MSASELAIENFAKAVIAIFEVPTWSHDPSNQLNGLIGRLPDEVADEAKELASEMAQEHGKEFKNNSVPNFHVSPKANSKIDDIFL